MKKALILVDIQHDFCKGGSLEVPNSNEILPFVNNLISNEKFDLIVATQDYHPSNHGSFASNNNKNIGDMHELGDISQIMWPDHCVEGTKGVEFHPELDLSNVDKIFKKGENPKIDSYSGFYDNDHNSSTGLSEYLKENNITDVTIVGLALDYCVKFTALDAINEEFKTKLLINGTRAVNINPNDGKNAIKELKEAGVICL